MSVVKSFGAIWLSPFTSSALITLCQTWAFVIRIVNVCSSLVSMPPLAVPPSSISLTVTCAIPTTFGFGVNLRLPVSGSIAGPAANRGLLWCSTLSP